jgi:hypothetical protein
MHFMYQEEEEEEEEKEEEEWEEEEFRWRPHQVSVILPSRGRRGGV